MRVSRPIEARRLASRPCAEDTMDTPFRHFLEIPYDQLEEMNLQA